MALHQGGQGQDTALPIAARFVGEDRGGLQQLAGAIDHGHFHAGANPRVQPHHSPRPGGGGQEQVAQVVAKDFDGHGLGSFAQTGKQVALNGQAQLHAPCPGDAFAQQVIALAVLVAPAQVQSNMAFGQAHLPRNRLLGLHQLGIQNLQAAAPKNGQRPVRRNAANGLFVIKIITELGHFGLLLILACHQAGAQQAIGPKPFAQLLHQRRILSPALGQNVAHAIEHGLGGRKIRAWLAIVKHRGRLAIGLGVFVGIERGVGQQLVGQRLNAELFGNLAFGAALLLERQVNIFQLLLGGHLGNRQAQGIGQLALLINGFEHGAAPLIQLAQVGQAHLQLTQLGIVQPARGLFAVTGNKRHRRPAIQ